MTCRIVFLFLFLLGQRLPATNPVFTIVPQPVNLVGDSQAGCIPLAPTVCYANYHFGIHKMISAPRPFLRGARQWERGTESNANLASAFGILVKPTDDTLVPDEPVEILIKDWDSPPYSPHTKEEVLTATIHCLLLSCHASPDRPLDLRITTENKKDRKWAEPYQKKYIRMPGDDRQPVTPTRVGESFVMQDDFGIRYVISKNRNPDHKLPKAPPVILPLEFEEGGALPGLIPVWSGDVPRDPLQAIAIPRGRFHHVFRSGVQFSRELNPLLADDQPLSITTRNTEDQVEVTMSFGSQSLPAVSAGITSAVLISQLHFEKPTKVTVTSYEPDSPLVATILKTPGWEKSSVGTRAAASATLAYETKQHALTGASLPGDLHLHLLPNGRMFLKKDPN